MSTYRIAAEMPFTPHGPASPSSFVGRVRELDLIEHHLRPAQRGNVAVSGDVGSGKTTLLKMVADRDVGRARGMVPPGFRILYVDLHAISPFSGKAFWHRVGGLLARQSPADLESVVVPLMDGDASLMEVEEFLDRLAEQDTVLVLLLDEFEWALHADDPVEAERCRHFLAETASLARRTPRTLALVVATEQPLSEALSAVEAWRGSPFSTLFTSIALKPFDRDEADRLATMARRAGVDPSPSEMKLCYDLSEGVPALMQAACSALVVARQSGKSNLSVERAIRDATERAQASLRKPSRAMQGTGSNLPDAKQIPERGLWIDDAQSEVVIDGRREVSLTALEYNLLRLLYDQPGQLRSKREIIRHVWGEEARDDVDEARVEKLISRLRQKIETAPGRPRYVRTVRGRGYRLITDGS